MNLRVAFLVSLIRSFINSTSFAAKRLYGKVAIITGGSKRIEVGIAEVFTAEGAKVVILSRTEKDLKRVVDNISKQGGIISYVVRDITSLADMKNMVDFTIKQYGRVDILVHNAVGIYLPVPIIKMANEEWEEALKTNLTGAFYAVKSVLSTMEKQKYGRIIFTSSISGPRVGLQTKSHYAAAKSGMNGFMRSIAIELAKYNITVNAVEPGNIMTEGLKNNSIEVIKERARAIPIGRLDTVKETAYAHLFLASDEAAYTTGQSIIVDGGQTLPETHFSEF